jgi:hypothetical protein
MPSNGATDAAVVGAVVGVVDAGVVALGDVDELPHAAKTIVIDAASTAPLTDHLFGVWDMRSVSSSVLRSRTVLPPCPTSGACLSAATVKDHGAGPSKPSISESGRHASIRVDRGPWTMSRAI